MKLTHRVNKLLEAPPREWEGQINQIKPASDVAAIVRELDGLIQKASRLRGYIDERYGNGCGDQGHKAAVKESNRIVRKIRKALGFTYPEDPFQF